MYILIPCLVGPLVLFLFFYFAAFARRRRRRRHIPSTLPDLEQATTFTVPTETSLLEPPIIAEAKTM